jgi:hypothetical protein
LEQAIHVSALPEKLAEEVWLESVRILKCSCKLRDSHAEKKSLWTLKAKIELISCPSARKMWL